MPMSDYTKNIIKRASLILKENLPDSDSPMLLALSGGGDSIALGRILIDLKKLHHRKIYAYHLEHGIRGESSKQDAKFVENWCAQNSIPLTIEHAHNLEESAVDRDQSIEEAAREYRYSGLISEAERINADVILTGHTLDDDIETFILRMSTGASLKALSGIPVCSRIANILLVRPLLDCGRDELRKYLEENSESWVEDETNLQPDTLRNRVRLLVLPHLSEIFSRDVGKSIARTISNIKRESDLLDTLLCDDEIARAIWKRFETEWKIGFVASVSDLKNAHAALRYRILLWALNELHFPLKRRKADIFIMADDFIRLKGGKKAHHIGNGVFIARSGKGFIVACLKDKMSHENFDPVSADARMYVRELVKMTQLSDDNRIQKPGRYKIGEYEVIVEAIDTNEINLEESESDDRSIEYFDPSILDGGIELVFGSTITGSEKLSEKPKKDIKEEYTKLGNRTLVDFWVKWPVLKKDNDVIWIVGVCRRDMYSHTGQKVLKISVLMPVHTKVFI
jgi:tRNA(Ile)-lysidine synthetase-like protein